VALEPKPASEISKRPHDSRFLPFTDKLNLVKLPETKIGCDFCLEEARCAKWDEVCAIAHPECAQKCGKLRRVSGPACLLCIEKAGCEEWDSTCNDKAPHCMMFCECGKYKDCKSCAQTKQCSWCAFSADSKLDHMSSCRYAADPDQAGCPVPAIFARYPNICAAAIRFTATGGTTNDQFIKSHKDLYWSQNGKYTKGKQKLPIVPDVIPPKTERIRESLKGVNYAPPPLSTTPLHDEHNALHDHYVRAAAMSVLHLHSGVQHTKTISEGPSDPVVELSPLAGHHSKQ